MAIKINKYYLTNRGNEILRLGISGTMIEISSLKLGDGVLPEEETALRALTALVNAKQNLPINSITQRDGSMEVSAAIRNDALTEGYYAREAGLYVRDPEGGKETLFAVSKLDGNYIPPYTASSKFNQIYTVHLAVGDAQITISADSDLYLLKKDALTIDQVYPVGASVLLFNGVDPNDLWPTTTWEKMGSGKALITAGDGYEVGKNYGSNQATIARKNLPKDKISISTDSAGNHQHAASDFLDEVGFDTTNGGGGDPEKTRLAYGDNRPYNNYKRAALTGYAGSHTHTGRTEALGSGEPLDITPASIAVNVWQRIA